MIGASNDLAHIGGQPLKLLTEFGYQGQVYPVNPKYSEIKGLPCYPDIGAVPGPCDVALIALSAPLVPKVIAQCGKAGIPFAIVLSAGFSEVGSEGEALQDQLLAAARTHRVRVVGPNCLGLMNLADHVRIGFGGTMQLETLTPGPIAMVTQSGGFGFGVAAIACYYGLGFNYIISTGNEADLTMLDWIADLIERPEVEIVTVFMEGITDGRRLIEIGERALELGKPILIWKVGNTDIEALTRCSLPFPLAAKLGSHDIPHKTEAGAVRLGIPDLTALKEAVQDILASARKFRPDARIDGILLQQMAEGFEVIVGAVNDPCFGPVVAFGLGGVFTELMKDLTYRFAPFDAVAAREMIAEIKGAALLTGYRGRPVLDTEALAEVLVRISLLMADHADRIAEIDINPLFVRPAGQGVVAADALIVLKGKS